MILRRMCVSGHSAFILSLQCLPTSEIYVFDRHHEWHDQALLEKWGLEEPRSIFNTQMYVRTDRT